MATPPSSTTRKGARSRADIPTAILRQLNHGEIEAVTLSEVLAVDMAVLMRHAFPDMDKSLVQRLHDASSEGWIERTRFAGALLYDGLGMKGVRAAMRHTSDQVRGWSVAAIRARKDLSLEDRLALMKPIADDANPGTRETAWIMMRPFITADLPLALDILRPWVDDKSPNIRRFATEITRPRGVWCAHIPSLRQKPQQALHLLEPVMADPSRYVQNSVANWMNDASKDNAAWVEKTVARWLKKSPVPETSYIGKRALRTLRKK